MLIKSNKKNTETCDDFQTHVHEFLGSVILNSPPDNPELVHNHRFAGITGPVKEMEVGHVHIICVNTDFFNHFHRVEMKTGPPIVIRDKDGEIIGHVHAFTGTTSCVFFHDHDFRGTTLIENPIAPLNENPCSCKKMNYKKIQPLIKN